MPALFPSMDDVLFYPDPPLSSLNPAVVHHLESPSQSPPPPSTRPVDRCHSHEGCRLKQYDTPQAEFRRPPLHLDEALFRHSGWCHARARVWRAMNAVKLSAGRRDRFCNCGAQPRVRVSPDGQEACIAASYCRDRFCVPCGRARAAQIANKVAQTVGAKPVRLVTLTLRHTETPLKDQITRLYRCFAKLRRTKIWINAVAGGYATLEVKLDREGVLWHPHLHILVEGEFIDQAELTAAWHKITLDSHIVDIRFVRNREQVVSYVCKYLTKPADNAVYEQPEKLGELILALQGVRQLIPFGTWVAAKLTEKPPVHKDWIDAGSVQQLLYQARSGDEAAAALLQMAVRHDEQRLTRLIDAFEPYMSPP